MRLKLEIIFLVQYSTVKYGKSTVLYGNFFWRLLYVRAISLYVCLSVCLCVCVGVTEKV